MGKGLIITDAGQGAPFRRLPSADGEIIGVFEPNTEIDLSSYDNGWYAVTFEGEQGYVAGKFVQALDGIEGLDGKVVKAAKKVAKAVKKANGNKRKANPAISKSMVKKNSSIERNPNGTFKKKDMSKAEKAKLYEANKVVSVERTDKGLKISLEGTNGFDGFDGFDDENLMNGLFGKLKTAIKKATEKYKPEVVKVTSPAVYEANKQITIRRTDSGFQIGVQGINGFDGLDGLEEEETLNGLLKNIGNAVKNAASKVASGVKNVATKVVGGSKQVVETANAVNNATAAVQTAAAATNQANSNLNNNQNLKTMEQTATPVVETGDKKKKLLLWGGIGLGAVVLGFVGYKLLKKKPAASAESASKLSGVSRKRKKLTKKIELS